MHCIRQRPKLLQVLGEDIRFSSSELHATDYHLIHADLRTMTVGDGAKSLHDKLFKDCALDPNVSGLQQLLFFAFACMLLSS